MSAEHVLLSGPSGVGKTALARHTLRKLDAYDYGHVAHGYVRCLGESTAGILRAALSQHPDAADPPRNTATADLRRGLAAAVEDPYILVLDEGDDLPATDALDALVDIDRLAIVAITHDADHWLARASDPVRRGIDRELHLDRYGVNELADILARRAESGLRANTWSRPQLERIADEVAGVARYGIQALRAAAELAHERGHRTIEPVDLDDCFERAQQAIRRANLRSLPFHHQVLYALVHDAGEIAAETLHERYDAIAEAVYRDQPVAPIARRTRRNKLAKLDSYELLRTEGSSRDRTYVVADPAVEPPVALPSRVPDSG